MTESGKAIDSVTTGLARRMNAHTMSRRVSVSMLWGVGIAVAIVCVSKFVSIPLPLISAVAIVLGISFIAGMIRGKLAQLSPQKAAITADAQLGFKERLGSAVELLEQASRREMAELQLEDAAEYARTLDVKAICPRLFPTTAKVLPLAMLILIFLMYVPTRYGRSAEVPAEVRQAIKQAGVEMETAVDKMDKELLSEATAELAKKTETAASELQDESLTKKEALKKLSNLVRETEALKMMGQIAEELTGDMTPEKRRILNELLDKLADSLKDLQGMEELLQEVMKAMQENLSPETLKELSAALQQMDIGASEMEALQKMAEQLAKGKRDVAQSMTKMFRRPIDTGGTDSADTQDEESGLMGSTAPGDKSAEDMKELPEYNPNQAISSDQGYDSELEGQISETGKSVTTEDKADLKKEEASVPYEEIYAKYRDAADDAIVRTKIPWKYKEHVKSYFDAIKPKEK